MIYEKGIAGMQTIASNNISTILSSTSAILSSITSLGIVKSIQRGVFNGSGTATISPVNVAKSVLVTNAAMTGHVGTYGNSLAYNDIYFTETSVVSAWSVGASGDRTNLTVRWQLIEFY